MECAEDNLFSDRVGKGECFRAASGRLEFPAPLFIDGGLESEFLPDGAHRVGDGGGGGIPRAASDLDVDFIHTIEGLGTPMSKHVGDTRGATHAEDGSEPFPFESLVELELAACEMEETAEIEIVNACSERGSHDREIKVMGRAVDHDAVGAEDTDKARVPVEIDLRESNSWGKREARGTTVGDGDLESLVETQQAFDDNTAHGTAAAKNTDTGGGHRFNVIPVLTKGKGVLEREVGSQK